MRFENVVAILAIVFFTLVFVGRLNPPKPKCVSIELLNGRVIRIDDVKQEGRYLMTADRTVNVPLDAVALVTAADCP